MNSLLQHFRPWALILIISVVITVSGCSVIEEKLQNSAQIPNETTTVPETAPTESNVGISPDEAARIVPLPPYQVITRLVDQSIAVEWPGTGGNIDEYRIYRKEVEDTTWSLLQSIKAVGDNRGSYKWNDDSIQKGIVYIYGVQAVNFFGTESAITESESVSLKE